MSLQRKYAVPPSKENGLGIFVRTAYPTRYNFAVTNYNNVSIKHKSTMFGGRLLLFRSIVAVVWIISVVFALLSFIKREFVVGTVILGLLYIVISIYNMYVFCGNGNLLNSSRFLRARVAGPSGLDYEWVSVPLDSRSANERLASVEQAALDNIRREFMGSSSNEINCMVYAKRYAESYPKFPKELLLHLFLFIVVIVVGIVVATL